jgi:glycosyltransferase involved in cell wall biosynthesis
VHSPEDIRIFAKECKSLMKHKYHVVMIAPADRNQVANGIQTYGVTRRAGSRFSRMTRTVWEIFKKADQLEADIYHFHDPELIPVGLLLRQKRKKVIYDVHEDVPQDIKDKPWIYPVLRKSLSFAFELFENLSVKSFSFIVAATPAIKKRLTQFNANIIDVNNYPFLDEFSANWNHKNREICYIGGLSELRGIKEMIQAMKFVHGKLNLAGRFQTQRLEQQVHELSEWQKVNWFGFVDREKMAEIVSVSCAGLVIYHPIANHIQAQPNKIFEYMSAGIPVIASNFPLWKEIVEGHRCGICVDPMNPENVGNAINYLLTHEVEAKQMGKNGRRAVEQKFNWEKEEKKLIKVYEQLSRYLH